jgi:hypothetical protein
MGQLARNGSSVTVIPSESGATRNIFFISQVLPQYAIPGIKIRRHPLGRQKWRYGQPHEIA